MERRTRKQQGFVQFPTHRESTEEGGMAVFLVVEGHDPLCFASDVFILHEESFVGAYPEIEVPDEEVSQKATETGGYTEEHHSLFEGMARRILKERHHIPEYKWDYLPEGLSRRYTAALRLGTTGWSGHIDGDYWRCTPEALTEEGQQLYESIKELYPDGTVRLLTTLDT